MFLTQSVPPASEPLTTAEAKAHLRITHSDEDTYIGTLIAAARQIVETRANLQLITATWVLTMNCFPWHINPFELPKAPLISVGSIAYIDQDGDSQVVPTDVYAVKTAGLVGRIALKYEQEWPSDVRNIDEAVTITFDAGYGNAAAVAAKVPAALHAMKLILGHLYANREQVVVGTIASELPQAVNALLNSIRIPEVL